MEDRLLRKNFLLSIAFQITRLIAPLITAPYVARVLGSEGLGLYSYLHSYILIFMLFAQLGTGTYATIRIASFRDSREEVSRVFFEVEILRIITTLFCTLVWVVSFGKGADALYCLALLPELLSIIFDFSWFFAGLENFSSFVYKSIGVKVVTTAAVFIFVRSASDLLVYFLISSCGILAGMLFMLIPLKGRLCRIPFKTLKPFSHIKDSLVFFIPEISTMIYTVLDKTLIGLFTANMTANAFYEQNFNIIKICKAITFVALNSVMTSRAAYLFANGKTDGVKKGIDESVGITMTLGCGFVFGICGMAKIFVPWFFGPEFAPSYKILMLFTPIILIASVSNILGTQYYTPAGLRAKSSVYLIVGSAVNLVLNLIVIPIVNKYRGAVSAAQGAVLTSVAAETVITVLYCANCNGFLTFRRFLRLSWKKFVSGAVLFVYLYLLSLHTEAKTKQIVALIVSGCMVYGIMLIILQDFKPWKLLKSKKGGYNLSDKGEKYD